MIRRLRRRALLLIAIASAGGAPACSLAQSPAERAERMTRALSPIGGDTASRRTVEQEIERLHVTGVSVAVVANSRVVWARGFGLKEVGRPNRVDTTTLFLAGSISKPVFASGVLALVEKGALNLDADINTELKSWHLPESRFTEKTKVSLRRILSHSAGLTVWGFPGYAVGAPLPTVPQVLDGAPPANTAAVLNDTTPGARWLYSGGGITIAQLAAADVTGEPFPALMKRLVLDRAGMTRSTYENPLPDARSRDAATGHERPDSAVVGHWHVYPEMAAAGLWTTASDLGRWGIAMMKAYRGEAGGILSPAMAREMLRPQMALPTSGPGGRPTGGWWGLGVEVGGSGREFNFSHGGRDEGFVALMMFYPEQDVGLVVLTNATNGAILNELRTAFRQAFLR